MLGEAIRAAMPSMERLRFTSSGTEAVMSALRVARAATGRDLVVKFAGAYHGHADGLLVEAGSGVATLAIAGSAGVPDAVAATTIVLPDQRPGGGHAGRSRSTRAGSPRSSSSRSSPTRASSRRHRGCLEHLREATRADGALLIFDEVITGFRLAPGGAQERFGITPGPHDPGQGDRRRDADRRVRRAAPTSWTSSRRPVRSTRPARCPGTRCRWPPGSRRWRS